MKTKFQINILKRNEVLNSKKKHLCRIFCSTTYQNLEMAIFRYLEIQAGIGCKTEKNPLFLQ